jgi:hypothetical protein
MLSGLLIRSPYIDWILAGAKTWGIRGSSTSKRDRIALIQSGTGTVVGVADLVGVEGPLTLAVQNARFPDSQIVLGQQPLLLYCARPDSLVSVRRVDKIL